MLGRIQTNTKSADAMFTRLSASGNEVSHRSITTVALIARVEVTNRWHSRMGVTSDEDRICFRGQMMANKNSP